MEMEISRQVIKEGLTDKEVQMLCAEMAIVIPVLKSVKTVKEAKVAVKDGFFNFLTVGSIVIPEDDKSVEVWQAAKHSVELIRFTEEEEEEVNESN